MRNTFLILAGLSLILLKTFQAMTHPRDRIAGKIKRIIDNSPYHQLSDYILAMAKVESGNFTHRNVKNLNNPFNMKNAVAGRKDRQYGSDTGNEFRHYDNIEQAALDLIDWFDFTNFPEYLTSHVLFVRELKARKYFEEKFTFYLSLMDQYV